MHPVLASRDGQCVDRVVGVLDENHNKFHEEKTAFFGFFGSINDQDAAKWYRKAAEQRLALAQFKLGAGHAKGRAFRRTSFALTCGTPSQPQR
jgi:TPR repeat protein